jgi:hypothetical protein
LRTVITEKEKLGPIPSMFSLPLKGKKKTKRKGKERNEEKKK